MRIGAKDSHGFPKRIRIVVVGEKGTGKSSLIMAAANGSLRSNIPHKLPYTNLHSEIFCDPIPATIIDTSSRRRDKEEVVKEVKQADAIVLTFAFDKPESLYRLNDYWLPLFRNLEVRVPIIVAGYKVEIRGYYNQVRIITIEQLLSQYREIETALEWCAQELLQAKDVFRHAHNAVMNPSRPIYDYETNSLKPLCVVALRGIFLISNHNKDGILSDEDLNNIQVKCFNEPLRGFQIEEMRKSLQVKCPEGVNENGVTWEGFLFHYTYLVQHGRIKKLWTILKKFGYNNDLQIADYMIPYSSFKRELDQSVELTNKAIGFLREIYKNFDADRDNNLGPQEIESLFQTAPDNPWNEDPYKNVVVKTEKGGFSCEAFLSLWSLMTLINPAKSLEYLIYIRYPGDPSSAIRVTRKRDLNRKQKKSDRKVVQCFVFGPKNAGKSALLNGFIGRSYNDGLTENRYAVNMVDNFGVIAKTNNTLVLKEIQFGEDEDLAGCDIAIFVYDSSDESSWKKSTDLLSEVAITSKVAGFEFPCLMVAAKAELESFPMELQKSISFTDNIGIAEPLVISSKFGDFGCLFLNILTFAKNPHFCIPKVELKKKKKKKWSFKLNDRGLMVVSVGTLALTIGLATFSKKLT